jgi:hypothetical protein
MGEKFSTLKMPGSYQGNTGEFPDYPNKAWLGQLPKRGVYNQGYLRKIQCGILSNVIIRGSIIPSILLGVSKGHPQQCIKWYLRGYSSTLDQVRTCSIESLQVFMPSFWFGDIT